MLVHPQVKNPQSVLQIISKGNRNRAVRHTEMNINSSRSHAILQITMEQVCGGGQCTLKVGGIRVRP